MRLGSPSTLKLETEKMRAGSLKLPAEAGQGSRHDIINSFDGQSCQLRLASGGVTVEWEGWVAATKTALSKSELLANTLDIIMN